MRRLGFILMCGLFCCRPALAAINDSSVTTGAELDAASAINAEYIAFLAKTYDDARAAHGEDGTAKIPPDEIANVVRVQRALVDPEKACDNRAAELKTIVALIQCRIDTARPVFQNYRAGETDLFEAFAVTALRIGADADAHKITVQQASGAFTALSTTYLSLAGLPVFNYLESLGKGPSGVSPPYDPLALPAANEAASRARTACDGTTVGKTSLALIVCLAASDRAFDEAIKIRDTTLSDYIAGILQRGGRDSDAGMLTREELLQHYDNWRSVYRIIIANRYAEYATGHYVLLYDRNYAAAQASHGTANLNVAPYDPGAAAQAVLVRNQAMKQCVPPVLSKPKDQVACKISAMQAFSTSSKRQNNDSFKAFAAAARQIIVDADAGLLASDEVNTAYNLVLAEYLIGVERENANAEAVHAKPMADAFVARLEKQIPAAPAKSALIAPYDITAWDAANVTLGKAAADCNARYADGQIKAKITDCYAPAYRQFAAATKLRDMALLNAYIDLGVEVAAQVDAQTITSEAGDLVDAALWAWVTAPWDQQRTDYLVAQNKPLIGDYRARFEKAYADAAASQTANDDVPPYDPAAEAAAAAERKKSTGLCDDRRAALKTQSAYVDCYLAADNGYAAAVNMRDKALNTVFDGQMRETAANADSGKLSLIQADLIWSALADAYDAHFLSETTAWNARKDKALQDDYVSRFQNSYAAAKSGRIEDQGPPLDFALYDSAKARANQGSTLCDSRHAELKTEVAYTECYIARNKAFADAMKLRDTALVATYVATLRGAAADSDSGKFDRDQAQKIYNALAAAYFSIYSKQYSDYLAATYKLSSDSYVARFQHDYANARAAKGVTSGPPYDVSLTAAALIVASKAHNQCNDQRAALKTQAAYAECDIAATRQYVATVKLADMSPFEASAAAIRQAAADADAGKLTFDQATAAYLAINNAYDTAWRQLYAEYQNRLNAPLIEPYVNRFDNAYFAAIKTRKANGARPSDPTAAAAAGLARTGAVAACSVTRTETKNEAAFAECLLAAEKEFSDKSQMHDQELFNQYSAAMHAAAADASAGKLSLDQATSVYIALSRAYAMIASSNYAD